MPAMQRLRKAHGRCGGSSLGELPALRRTRNLLLPQHGVGISPRSFLAAGAPHRGLLLLIGPGVSHLAVLVATADAPLQMVLRGSRDLLPLLRCLFLSRHVIVADLLDLPLHRPDVNLRRRLGAGIGALPVLGAGGQLHLPRRVLRKAPVLGVIVVALLRGLLRGLRRGLLRGLLWLLGLSILLGIFVVAAVFMCGFLLECLSIGI
mmetsp:Transcript_32107/g.90330  ORF Transcript_32107/g.90330 Transcript_32107/m.90330 type:complete len:206 (-) Transcript_32107:918-1535(-)